MMRMMDQEGVEEELNDDLLGRRVNSFLLEIHSFSFGWLRLRLVPE